MKSIICYKTSDDVIHESQRDAEKHAQTRYGDLLLKHAKALATLSKYSEFCDYLDNNRDELAHLVPLHADTVLTEEDED